MRRLSFLDSFGKVEFDFKVGVCPHFLSNRVTSVYAYLPDVFHGAHRCKGNATSSRRAQKRLVDRRRVVEVSWTHHTKSHYSAHANHTFYAAVLTGRIAGHARPARMRS